MRFLVSFVNSTLSLAGFDWASGKLFWMVPAERLKSCGICYSGGRLLIGSDNQLRIQRNSEFQTIPLLGSNPSLAHSVHPIDEHTFGVIDTGDSCLRVYDDDGAHQRDLQPLAGWVRLPLDAIHLNDFAVTPWGIIASCFDFRPWRTVRQLANDEARWASAGLGLLLELTALDGIGRIAACGLDHPHTLLWRDPDLVHCSSATGTLHFWRKNHFGALAEVRRERITSVHFLRGVCPLDDDWYLGGSVSRHTWAKCDAIYRFRESAATVDRKLLPIAGEIYDILPWEDDILRPLVSSGLGV